jgi:integrase
VPNTKLTDLAIKQFPTPDGGTQTYWDIHTKGFGLRVGAGGARTFIVLIESGRRQSLGRYPTIKLAEARTEAARILAEKTLGKIRPRHVAFDDAKEQFLAECSKRNRARTVQGYTRLLNRYYPYGRKSVADITTHDVVRRLNKLNDVPAEKHHAFAAGRVFFRWCIRNHIIERSPMEPLSVPLPQSSRDRVLSDEELAAVFQTAKNGESAFHNIVSLLALTGQRRGEIAALEWSWIDGDARAITFPASITKNKRIHAIPFGDVVADVFKNITRIEKNPYVFPAARDRLKNKPATIFNGWGKPKKEFDIECGVSDWTLHDLRRTLSTNWAALQIPQVVTEKYLNHVSGGTQSPIAQVYNRYSYFEEMQAAVTTWETHLVALVENK